MTNKIEATDGMLFSDYTNAIQDYIQSCINDAMNTQTQKTTEAINEAMKVRHIGQTFSLDIPAPTGNSAHSETSISPLKIAIPDISDMHYGVIQVQMSVSYGATSYSDSQRHIFHFIRNGNSLYIYDSTNVNVHFTANQSPTIRGDLSNGKFISDGFEFGFKGQTTGDSHSHTNARKVGCTIDIYAW